MLSVCRITSVVKNQLEEQNLDNVEDLLDEVKQDINKLLKQESETSSEEPSVNLPGFNDELNQGRTSEQSNQVLTVPGSSSGDVPSDLPGVGAGSSGTGSGPETENFHNLDGESAVYAPLHPDLKHQGPQGLQGIRGIE